MSDVLIEILAVGAVVAILASLIESRAQRFRPTTRGWILAIIGLGLVTIGALMHNPNSSSYVVGMSVPE